MAVRVLIIDDSSAMRKVLALALRKAKAEVSEVWEAGNGREALNLLEGKTPELILCDIYMPVMGGLEFLKRRKGLAALTDIPVVMISTEGGEHIVAEALSQGANGYVRKPFTQEQFANCILSFIPHCADV
jgi:two-component system chemotaxis response regulator CheY